MNQVSLNASFTIENVPTGRLKVTIFRFGQEIGAGSFEDDEDGYEAAFDFGHSEIELYNGLAS